MIHVIDTVQLGAELTFEDRTGDPVSKATVIVTESHEMSWSQLLDFLDSQFADYSCERLAIAIVAPRSDEEITSASLHDHLTNRPWSPEKLSIDRVESLFDYDPERRLVVPSLAVRSSTSEGTSAES